MRNSGSVIGGAINFSTNSEESSAGGIAWSTYLIFVGFGESLVFPAGYTVKLTLHRVHWSSLGLTPISYQQSPET